MDKLVKSLLAALFGLGVWLICAPIIVALHRNRQSGAVILEGQAKC